jgi:hypothetical protein
VARPIRVRFLKPFANRLWAEALAHRRGLHRVELIVVQLLIAVEIEEEGFEVSRRRAALRLASFGHGELGRAGAPKAGLHGHGRYCSVDQSDPTRPARPGLWDV